MREGYSSHPRLFVCLFVCLSVSVGFRSWLPFNRRKGYELELDDDLSPFNLPAMALLRWKSLTTIVDLGQSSLVFIFNCELILHIVPVTSGLDVI